MDRQSDVEYVVKARAIDFLSGVPDGSVDLILIDPPYNGVVGDWWDNQWESPRAYEKWLLSHLILAASKLKSTGSLVMFGSVGLHRGHSLFCVMNGLESLTAMTFRNMLTWKKSRGRTTGAPRNYPFAREEIVWYSKSEDHTFNLPMTETPATYKGAKRDTLIATNVIVDITEVTTAKRSGQKPLKLMERLVKTHSNEGDFVVDCFAGTGVTGVAALKNGRRFRGCDLDGSVVDDANLRCNHHQLAGDE